MKNGKSLRFLDEAQLLIIGLTVFIIFLVEFLSLSAVSSARIRDLRLRASVNATEIALLLEEPMYSIDDMQAQRIVVALLSSGEISGIKLESNVSGIIFDQQPESPSRWISPIRKEVIRDGLNVGTVELQFSDAEILNLQSQFLELALASVLAVILSSVLSVRYIIVRRIKKIFETIGKGINAISDGNYATVIPLGRYRDLNFFINLINDMAAEILSSNAELRDANNLLEERVLERTAALELTQKRLILSEKLSALGQLSAGIVHELNTPLGAISSSIGLLDEFIGRDFIGVVDRYAGMDNAQREVFLGLLHSALRENIAPPSGNERKSKKQLQLRLEGQGIPHAQQIAEQIVEMNIGGTFESLAPVLGEPWFYDCLTAVYQIVSARKMTEIIALGIQKSIVVVGALRSYLRDGPASALEPIDVGSSIDTILTLLHSKIKNEVTVVREYGGGFALGSPQSLSQVWLNLINNSLQAMEYRGILTVRTGKSGGCILVEISDSGPGIPDAIQGKIFEPFFSTKEYADGMGLGLDICKRIVEQFGGSISFESVPGHTCFTVQLLSAD